jgi:hypothetical protein
MSIALDWKRSPDELSAGEVENRRRIESVFASVFAKKGDWTGEVLEEDISTFRARFHDSSGNPIGPPITFSAMAGYRDVRDLTAHLR